MQLASSSSRPRAECRLCKLPTRSAAHGTLYSWTHPSRAHALPDVRAGAPGSVISLPTAAPSLHGSRSGGPMLRTSHAPAALRRRLRMPVRPVLPSVVLRTLLGTVARAQTFYVDAQSGTCSSAGPGTEAEPYCSIAAAMAAHKGAGITIVVKPGIYREQLTIPTAGLPGAPFVFQA